MLEPPGDEPVERSFAAPGNEQRRAHPNDEEVIFKPLALLPAKPVHKEALRPMHRDNGSQHYQDEAPGGKPCQESRDQAETAD